MADTNTILSSIAISMSGLSLLWQVWTYFHSTRRQRKEREERVRVTATLTPCQGKQVFGVEVYNEGNVDVYLRDVQIIWSDNGSERHIPLHRDDNTLSLLLAGEKPPKPGSLPPRKSEPWILWRNDLDPITEIVKVASDKVRVPVYSHGGEISRIGGKTVLPLLVELEKAWADELRKRS